jgi:hypothetical protein
MGFDGASGTIFMLSQTSITPNYPIPLRGRVHALLNVARSCQMELVGPFHAEPDLYYPQLSNTPEREGACTTKCSQVRPEMITI